MPDFATKSIDSTSPFSFLNSASAYSRYYLELESQMRVKKKTTSHVSILNFPLKPINRYHTMHSYWKPFRLAIERDLKNFPNWNIHNNWDISNLSETDFNKIRKDFFFFLPLVLKIPIGYKDMDGERLPIKFHVYLFPFGVCCVQMRIMMQDKQLDVDKFVQLIDRIPTKIIINNGLNFNDYALFVTREINQLVFGENTNVKGFSPHTIVSIIQTEPDIEYTEDTHPFKKHITEVIFASILSKKSYAEVDNLGQPFNDQILKCQLKAGGSRPDQLLYFTLDRTLLYISPSWVNHLSRGTEYDKKLKKVQCMMYNYRSFFTLTFSANRFFRECLPHYLDKVPQSKLQEIMTYFAKVFPEGRLNKSAFDYKGNLDSIGDAIKFKDTLKIINELSKVKSSTPNDLT